MDDIRRPQHLKRRDYAIPAGRPPQPARPHPHPPNHQTHHHNLASQSVVPGIPVHPPRPAPTVHTAPAESLHSQTQPHYPVPSVKSHPRKIKFTGKIITVAIGGLIAAAAIFGAGYLLKGSNDSKGIPVSITRQVNYDLYFPSPMPPGYTYMKDTATFQIGQVFYKFSNGRKRVTVNEQPMPDPKPDLRRLPGYTQITSPVGKAVIGTDVGQPTAVILTPTTQITMHGVGGVTKDDLKVAVSNLKNIGQKPN